MTLKAIKYQTGYVFVDKQAKKQGWCLYADNQVQYLYANGVWDRPRWDEGAVLIHTISSDIAFVKIIAQTPDLTLPIPCVELEKSCTWTEVHGGLFQILKSMRELYSEELKHRWRFNQQIGDDEFFDLVIKENEAAQAKQYSEEDMERYALEQQIKTLTMLANVQPKEVSEQTYRLITQFKEGLHTLRPQVESIELEMNPLVWLVDEPVTYQKDGREYYRVKSITYKQKAHEQS